MSSFTGVSIIADKKLSCELAIDAGADSGYHLLVVQDYSRTVREMPNSKGIHSGTFMVGGHKWCIWYYPNGFDPSSADFISLFVTLVDGGAEKNVGAQFAISFVDQVEYQKPFHIRATETYSFSSKNRCGSVLGFMTRDALERSAHLKGDCFTIRCDIIVCKDIKTQDARITGSDIHQDFNYLLQSKVGTDVTFEVNGVKFAAHRCMLAARSEVFRAQLFGPMTESTTSSVIQIKDMTAQVFAVLLHFIYTDSVPAIVMANNMTGDDSEVEQGQEEEEERYVMWLQDLFVAADRYDLQRFKLFCEEQLIERLGVSSVASTLALAEQHYCHGLKEVCLKFIQVQSPKSLEKVMATDGWEHITKTYPSVLKELIAKLASNQKAKERKPNQKAKERKR